MAITIDTKVITNSITDLNEIYKYYSSKISDFSKTSSAKKLSSTLDAIRSNYKCIAENTLTISNFLVDFYNDINALEFKMSNSGNASISVSSVASIVSKTFNSIEKSSILYDKIFDNIELVSFTETGVTVEGLSDLSMYNFSEEQINALLLNLDTNKPLTKEESKFLTDYYNNILVVQKQKAVAEVEIARDAYDKLKSIEKELMGYDYNINSIETAILNAKEMGDYETLEKLENIIQKSGFKDLVSYEQAVDAAYQNLQIKNAQLHAIEKSLKQQSYLFAMREKEYQDFKPNNVVNKEAISSMIVFDEASNTFSIDYKAYCNKYGNVDPFTFLKIVKEQNQYAIPINIKESDLLERLSKASTSSTFQEDYSNYYVYLYETQGVDSALEYLNAIEEDINRYCGELDAKEFFDSLADLNDEESRLLAINNHLRTTTQGLGLGAIGSLENIGYLMEGIFSSNENRIYSDLEYQMMYISQGLASEEDKINAGLITKGADGKVISVPGLIDYTADYGKFLDINFNLSQNIGNMLPSMVMSTVTGGIAGTNQLAQLFAATLSKGTFGLSAAGGSFHTAMVEGHDKNLSLLYGAISGSSEILTESLLGSLPFMNDVNVVGFKTFMKASLQEGFEEFVQEYLDAAVRTFTFNDRYLKDELFDNACVSFMYGMASGGIMNSGKLVSNVLSSQNVKNQIAAGNITQEQLVSEFHNQFKDSLEMDFNDIMKNNTKAAEAVGMQLVEKNGKTKAEGPIKSALSGLGVLGLGTSFFGGSSNGNGSTSNSSSSSNNNSTVRRNTAINNRNKTTSSKSENKTDSKDSLTSQREQLLRDNPGLKELNDRANLGVAVNVSSDLSDAFSRLRQLDSQIKKNEIDLTKVKQVNSDFKDAKTISDVENIISLKLNMKQILNAETVKLLPKALLGAIDMLGFLGAHFKYDSVLKSDAMVQKIVNDGLYHITSMENVQKILDSGYVKAGNVISSYGNKKSFFFAGTPGVGDVASNIGNFLDKHVAVKFDIDKSQVSDFRYRSLGDQAVTYDGNFNFLPSQAHLVYLGMVYENGKLAYKEISKSEFDNYESLIGKNKIENLKLNLQNLVLGYAFEYNNTIKRINLIKDAFSDASIKNAMANLSKSFSSLLGSKMDTDMSIAYATEGVGNSSIDSMINEYNSIIDNNPEVRKMLVVGASIGDVSSDIMQQYMRASFLETQILKSDTHANQTKNLQSLKSKLSDAKLVLQNTLGNIKNKLFEFNQVKNTTPFAKLIQEVNLKESTQTVRDLKNTILESMPNELSPIEKARWAYIELGKMLNFDENLNSNPEKMYAQVYNKHYEITDDSIIKNNKVICTSWSKIYGDILTSLGIENIVQGEKGSHQWVEFKVNDVYIYADATTGGYSNPQDLAKIHLGEATTNFKPIYHFSEGKYIPHQVYSEGSGSFDNILSVIDQNIKYIKDGYDIARTSIEFNENDSISDKLQKLSQTAKLNTLGFVEGKSFLLNFVKNLSDTEKSKVSGCDFSKILADGDVELVNVTAVQLDDGNYKYFAFHEGVGFTPVTSHDIDMLIRDGFKMAEGKGLSGYKFNQIRSIRDSLLEKAFPLSFAKQYLLNETKNFTSLLKNDTLNIASKTNAFVKNHNLSNFQNSIKTILNQKITNSHVINNFIKNSVKNVTRVAKIGLVSSMWLGSTAINPVLATVSFLPTISIIQDACFNNIIKNSFLMTFDGKKINTPDGLKKVSMLNQNYVAFGDILKSRFANNKTEYFTVRSLNALQYLESNKSYGTTSQAFTLFLLKQAEKKGFIKNLTSMKSDVETNLTLERLLLGVDARDKKIQMYDIYFETTDKKMTLNDIEGILKGKDLSHYKIKTDKNGRVIFDIDMTYRDMIKTSLSKTKSFLNQKITNSILSKFLPNLSHLEDYVKTNSESILRVADVDLENVQTKSTNGNTVNTSNFEKYTIKDLPLKTQEFISKLSQNSDYLSLKAFTESLIYGYKNGDESTKKVIENIDVLDKLSQVPNLYLADTLEIEKSSFSDNNRFLHNNKMFITNEVGNDFQIIAHEIGHMLLDVIDNTTLPENFDTIITKIQNNWSQDSSRLLSFLNEARDYKETIWTKSVEMGEQYAKEQDANFNEHIKQLYEDNVELEKELSKAATTYDISDMELQRMMRENDYEAISKLLKRYYVNLYISEDFTYRSNNDSSMQIYDVVAGLIDSVYNGNNPYYSTIYDNGFLRSHTSNYYKKKNTNSFDEQFADFTRMKLYDMQAVEIITKELLGNEWFLMMDEKFAQIANKMENHETSYEVSNKSILDTVFQNISFNSENSFRDVNLENISKKTNTFISNHTSSNLFSKFSNLYKEFVGKVSLKFKTLWSGNSSKIESRYLNILHEYEMLLEQNPNLYSSLKEYYTNPSSFKNKNDVQLNRLIYLNNQLHSLSSTIRNNSFSEEVITKDMVSKAIDSHITDAATQQFLLNKLSRIIEKNPSSIAISFQDPKQYIISKFPAMAVRNNQNSSFYQDYLAYLHKTSSLSVNEISFSEVYNTFSKYMTAYERIVLNDLVTSTNSAFHNYTDVQKSAISFYTKISGPMLTAFLRKAVITFSSLKSSSQYDGTNINKIEDLLNRSFQYWENKQIASIKNNVSSYKNIFTNVNSFVKIMDSLFKNAPSLKEDTTVYRVVDGLYHNGKQLLSYDIGTIFRDNAFLSTTLVDGSFGQKDFTKIKLKIEIPKGTQAVYMEQFTGVQNYTQQELLLNRGTSLQIVGDLYLDESNHYVLPVRVVNPEFSRMGIDSFEDTSSIDAYFKENYSSLANQKSLSQVVSYMKENGLNLKFEKQIETLKQQKVYDFQNAEHGFEHIRNVLFYAMYMGEKMNLTSQEKKILTAACAYHDSGLKFTTHASEHGKVGAQIIEHYLDSSYSRYEMKMIQAAILYHEMEDTKDNFQYVLQTYGILEQDVNSLYRICSILKDADAIDSVRFPGNLNPTKLRNDISKTLIQASYQMQNIRAKNILNTKIEKNQYNKKSLDSISLLKSKGVSDYLIYMYIENSWYQKTYKELTNLLNRKE